MKHIGWRWLAVREDRDTIIKYVNWPLYTYCSTWPSSDPDYESIQRDRRIIELLKGGWSLRKVGAQVDRSYNHIARCRDIYSGVIPLPETVETLEDRERTKLFREARTKLTKKDVRDYLAGRVPIREFAERMHCNTDDAYYWLKVAAARWKIKWER